MVRGRYPPKSWTGDLEAVPGGEHSLSTAGFDQARGGLGASLLRRLHSAKGPRFQGWAAVRLPAISVFDAESPGRQRHFGLAMVGHAFPAVAGAQANEWRAAETAPPAPSAWRSSEDSRTD